MSNLQLSKLKSGIKNGTEVTLNLSSNAVGESNDETNFPLKVWLTNIQPLKIWEPFANSPPANKYFWKT